MNRKLEDLINIPLLQSLQDKLNAVYSFPSAILDIDGKILTAVAWQDICTKFHRINPESEKECIKSDKYILDHLHEANPTVSYQCPHGLVDNATPIIIDGMHLGNFFTGQFFLEKPDLEFFRNQAKVFGFDEKEYLAAVAKVPVWTKEKLDHYIDFIKEFIEIVAGIGLKNLKEIEINNQLNRVNSELEIANRKLFEEIEEHRQTAEAQQKSEELFRTVFEFSTVGKSLTSPEGKLLKINKAFTDMLGYTLDEMTNINYTDITYPDDIAESRETIRSLIAKEKSTRRFEKRYFHKNGSIVWTDISTTLLCDNSGIPLYFITSIQDISERKEAEEALRNSEIRYRTLFNEAPVMVWEEDFSETKQYLDNLKLKGISNFDAYFETNPDELLKFLSTVKILNVNNATLSFYQAPNLEYLKQNFAQIFTEESFQVFKKAIINLADNRVLFEDEFTQRTFSGQIRNVHMRVFLPESEANTFSRVIVVMIDITERLQAQKEIQQANEELAELIAQKDKFFSIIAHDLKSPFQGFLGLTEIMAADASSFTIKELNEFSHRINKSATVLYELLVNLLEWAQIQRGAITCKPEGLNLLEITFKTTDTLRAVAAQKEIKIDTAVPESMEIFADEKMINSVIRNLLSNAIKFTPRGGEVIISAKETGSGKVEISVSDNGVGMSKEHTRKLFKFDERVGSEGTENEPSSGLGLLLCKEFVEKNNGEIWVESEPGKGSIFHFTIPSGRGT